MGIINTATYLDRLGVYVLKWDAEKTYDAQHQYTYENETGIHVYVDSTGIPLYTTYRISALATSEPTALLAMGEWPQYFTVANYDYLVLPNGPTLTRWVITEVTSEQILCDGETLFDVGITILSPDQDYLLDVILEEDTPFSAEISYSRGSPAQGSITAEKTTFTAGSTVTIASCHFTGFVMRTETWKDDDGIPWGRAYVSDYGSEAINRIIVGPYFFPGSDGYTKCYRDGTDHTVDIATALGFLFTSVGLTATGLPTGFGFHSGLNGEKTWVVSMQPIGQIAQVAYELTNYRPIWSTNKCQFGLNRVTALGTLKYTGSGQDYSSYRASVVGMGADGLTHTDGSGYPQGFIVMPGITDATELGTIVASVKANCRTANTKIYKGQKWDWNIGDDCLSARMSIANKARYWAWPGHKRGTEGYSNYNTTDYTTTDVEVVITDL
jgi:hypothetical protein